MVVVDTGWPVDYNLYSWSHCTSKLFKVNSAFLALDYFFAKQSIRLKAKENIRIKTYLKPFLACICLPDRSIAAYLH